MEVVRRKVGFLWMRSGEGHCTGDDASEGSRGSTDEADEVYIVELGERGDHAEPG